MGASTGTKHNPLSRQLIDDVPGIGKGTRQPVELGHHERIAGSAGRHCFTETWAHSIRSRESVIDEDLGLFHTHSNEGIALGSEVLVVRRDPCITDLHSS